MNLYPYDQFSEEEISATQPAMKVGILATVNPAGQPHLTLITTLMACGPGRIAWGAFTEGLSKQNVLTDPHTGFLIMTLDKHLWRGAALFTHTARQGPEYDLYNNTPMFRYNAYFGVHTVYFMDLIRHTGRQALPMNKIIFAAIKTMAARTMTVKRSSSRVINPWTTNFFNKLDNLKFISYVGADGFPVIIPLIQAQTLDGTRLVFASGVYDQELAQIPVGAETAVFGMALSMEDVLVRGTYLGMRRIGGIKVGIIKADWVYNPMPPAPAQIYPPVELKAITEF